LPLRNTTSRRERADICDGEGQLFRPADETQDCGHFYRWFVRVVPALRFADAEIAVVRLSRTPAEKRDDVVPTPRFLDQ
jgi:hypothetical protein